MLLGSPFFWPLAHSLTHSLSHSVTRSLTRSLTHSLTHLLTHSIAHPPGRSPRASGLLGVGWPPLFGGILCRRQLQRTLPGGPVAPIYAPSGGGRLSESFFRFRGGAGSSEADGPAQTGRRVDRLRVDRLARLRAILSVNVPSLDCRMAVCKSPGAGPPMAPLAAPSWSVPKGRPVLYRENLPVPIPPAKARRPLGRS